MLLVIIQKSLSFIFTLGNTVVLHILLGRYAFISGLDLTHCAAIDGQIEHIAAKARYALAICASSRRTQAVPIGRRVGLQCLGCSISPPLMTERRTV